MLIISLETSTNVCSVALHSFDKLIAYAEITIDKSHAEKITFLIEEVCVKAQVKLKEIDAIAISEGPGSYTGLRIASSTAKGICYALDKPLIKVDTLQSIALEASKLSIVNDLNEDFWLIPMIDARRMEVYTATYNGKVERVSEFEAKIIDTNSYSTSSSEGKKLIFCGNGADKCKDVISYKNVLFIDGIYPKAEFIGYLAYEKYIKNDFADIVNFEPFYLKEFYMAKSKNNALSGS